MQTERKESFQVCISSIL